MDTQYTFPSWTCEGQLSLLDPDDTPPHGLPRPTPPAPPLPTDVEVALHTTEELVAIGQGLMIDSDEESDLYDSIVLELERRGVRLFGRWLR